MALSIDRVREALYYDELTGIFTWKNRMGKISPGDVAGSQMNNGYLSIGIDYERCLAHRLAWFWIHGVWPHREIDHVDGDRSNNRLANLREATSQQNKRNAKISVRNTSGHTGVSWDKRLRKWSAYIKLDGAKVYLGLFPDLDSAVTIRREAEERHFGEFARRAA